MGRWGRLVLRLRGGLRRRARARLGPRGERAAVRALRAGGYRVLARNVRSRGGEVDVLALDGETLVVVEVKTRSGSAAAGAGPGLRQRRRLSAAWTALARGAGAAGRPRRFDVVAVRFEGRRPVCTIVRGAFRGDRAWPS